MTTALTAAAVFGVLMSFLVAACGTEPAATREARVDALMEAYVSPAPGASVLVVQDGAVVYKKAFGVADVEAGEPATTQTNYRLASVTKQFTATAILLLVERGLLNYETNLTEIFDGFPAYGEAITLSHLLSHTSGLIDYEDLIPDTATVQVKDSDVLAMMMRQDSTYFEPGKAYRYSNTAYALLAMTVEQLTGQRFADFLDEAIFTPVGMSGTVAHEQGVSEVPHRAYGHVFDEESDAFVKRDQSITSAVLGDGGVYSSVEDLLLWERALRERRLLSDSTWTLAWTAKPNTRHGDDLGDDTDRPAADDNSEYYGYGIYVRTYRGHRVLRHSGSTMGFRNDMERFPDLGLSVYVLTNRNSPAVIDLTRSIADVYLDASDISTK